MATNRKRKYSTVSTMGRLKNALDDITHLKKQLASARRYIGVLEKRDTVQKLAIEALRNKFERALREKSGYQN
jgi:hypothetical protein